MRHVLPGPVLALFICAMFGCGGSDSDQTADAGGSAPASSAPAGAPPASAPPGPAGGSSGPPAGMLMPGGPAAPGAEVPPSDPAATDAGVATDVAMPSGPGPGGAFPGQPNSVPGMTTGSTPP